MADTLEAGHSGIAGFAVYAVEAAERAALPNYTVRHHPACSDYHLYWFGLSSAVVRSKAEVEADFGNAVDRPA